MVNSIRKFDLLFTVVIQGVYNTLLIYRDLIGYLRSCDIK